MSPSATGQNQPTPDALLSELLSSVDPTASRKRSADSAPLLATHPTDSSRILLGLMTLARRADESDGQASESLGGAISREVLRSLLTALHHRDENTILHSRRVALVCVGIGRFLGWNEEQLKMLEVAALLHDIGKIGVPDHILFKPGKLSADESELMALHHNIAIDVLQACRVHKEVLDIVLQSHLHYNGANDGYRRIGSDVHQGARILAVADAYESLTSSQVYREGKTHPQALKFLMEAAGAQFDGNVVLSLSRWVDAEGLPFDRKRVASDRNCEWSRSLTPEEVQEANALCHIFSYLYLLESLYDGFYVVDSDRRYVLWNCGAERLLGHAPHTMVNHTWSSRVLKQATYNGKPLADRDCPLNVVLGSGHPVSNIMKWQHANGSWVDAEVQSVPLIGRDGQLHGVAEIFRDVSRTSRRPMEYRELKLAASRDPLTSVANRGELETQLTLLVNEFAEKSNADPFSVIFLDIDHFKSINDTYGHAAGDQVLIETARLMQHETYSGELVSRYGGEEFVILCPSTDLKHAKKRAERLRQSVGKKEFAQLSGNTITASFGVAQIERGDSVASLLRRADRALYISKETGRNKTMTLTNDEFLNGTMPEPEKKTVVEEDPFEYRTTFHACVAAEMIVYKLGGFLADEEARLVEAKEEEATLHLGSRGLLGSWGSTDDRQPVSVHVSFSTKGNAKNPAAASTRVPVHVIVRPRGWVRNSEVFQSRAKRVIKALRSYFAAE